MKMFSRNFPVEYLSDVVLRENAWLCDLLGYWRPPGELFAKRSNEQHASQVVGQALEENPKHLRLAIRHGYVNFYRAGQSVANVAVNHFGKLEAKIHNKYVYGKEGKGQGYVALTSAGFPEPGTGRPVPYDRIALDKWISNANEYVHDEKCFVDAIVAWNPNVIDLEMGLPAYSDLREERHALRMDMVALEPIGYSWRIVFWEAKLVGDGRARCSEQVIPRRKPEVLKQLGDYTDWLRRDNNCERVVSEYKKNCELLVAFHKIAKRFNPNIEELGAGIRLVATSGALPLLIDEEPRLVIDARKPNRRFEEKGHLEKLRNTGLQVKMVRGGDQMKLERPS